MENKLRGPSSFSTQANALLRKNLTFQKRNMRTNMRLILFPVGLCLLLVLLQYVVNSELNKPENKCGCRCVDINGDGQCEQVCGIEYSTPIQAASCSIPYPPQWPPLMQIPAPQYRAVRTALYSDLPDESCRSRGSCPVALLFTGNNQSLGESVARNMYSNISTLNSSDTVSSLLSGVLGSSTYTRLNNYLEPAFFSDQPVYSIQPQCSSTAFYIPLQVASVTLQQEIRCVQGLYLWRNSSSAINAELYKGYRKGNSEEKINEITAAYDFLNSDASRYNVSIWFNSTYKNDSGNLPVGLIRIPRSVNLASNAFLQFLLGPATKMLFKFVKEMPRPATKRRLDLTVLLGPIFFTWVILQLFPVVLISLVYEKEQNLRIMMKMHGLGDGAYWLISYTYFLVISLLYMFFFVVFGSLIGLKFFTLNDYTIQFVFYFIYANLQICLAFLLATFFVNVKIATVVGYILVFGTGLLGGFLYEPFLQDSSFPRGWIIAMELYPGFSLYRGLYEFAQSSFKGVLMGTEGMQWRYLNSSSDGMREILIIMLVEWLVILFAACYIDQVMSFGTRVGKSPISFLQKFIKNSSAPARKPTLGRQESKVCVGMDSPDVIHEREKVDQLLVESSVNPAILCDDLKKVYPARDGNSNKFAVRGLSLTIPQGECFGMLGPNGAGKTSFINMMIGLIKPSSGSAYVQGLDILSEMDKVYANMGVCPQQDLLWETLTGREHLLFYGRLKNLKGGALTQAVKESLKSVNLFHGGVADKQAGRYSGGMKRRLSVAISLIGDPRVVYLDEPSTGLDPASRYYLWNVVKRAKKDRAIILTTHSMEEAEHLCDRLGIFVDGNFQCIGNPKELKGRYGGSYVFTITTSPSHNEEVATLVRNLSPNANKIYHISGTQKFEIPKQEVRITDVFQAVENAKSRFSVHAWGLSDTTLEDVFIKVARGTQSSFNILS